MRIKPEIGVQRCNRFDVSTGFLLGKQKSVTISLRQTRNLIRLNADYIISVSRAGYRLRECDCYGKLVAEQPVSADDLDEKGNPTKITEQYTCNNARCNLYHSSHTHSRTEVADVDEIDRKKDSTETCSMLGASFPADKVLPLQKAHQQGDTIYDVKTVWHYYEAGTQIWLAAYIRKSKII